MPYQQAILPPSGRCGMLRARNHRYTPSAPARGPLLQIDFPSQSAVRHPCKNKSVHLPDAESEKKASPVRSSPSSCPCSRANADCSVQMCPLPSKRMNCLRNSLGQQAQLPLALLYLAVRLRSSAVRSLHLRFELIASLTNCILTFACAPEPHHSNGDRAQNECGEGCDSFTISKEIRRIKK